MLYTSIYYWNYYFFIAHCYCKIIETTSGHQIREERNSIILWCIISIKRSLVASSLTCPAMSSLSSFKSFCRDVICSLSVVWLSDVREMSNAIDRLGVMQLISNELEKSTTNMAYRIAQRVVDRAVNPFILNTLRFIQTCADSAAWSKLRPNQAAYLQSRVILTGWRTRK